MRTISADKIRDTVRDLCVQANLFLRNDVLAALKTARASETNKRAKDILEAIIMNAEIAKKKRLAICQDTGFPCVFIEKGEGLKINGDLKLAINRGVSLGYEKGFLRSSVVKDPLLRGRPQNQPAVVHTDIVKGDKLKITVLPKGFGCENKARLKMFNPTAGINDIKKFIIETVRLAGPDACPPFVVGVGIGGTADYTMYLAKKALLRKITTYDLPALPAGRRLTTYVSKLEKELLKEINKLNIGPMGLGGRTTALGVNIMAYPTHIAGLPVAVNISCHALRSASEVL